MKKSSNPQVKNLQRQVSKLNARHGNHMGVKFPFIAMIREREDGKLEIVTVHRNRVARRKSKRTGLNSVAEFTERVNRLRGRHTVQEIL